MSKKYAFPEAVLEEFLNQTEPHQHVKKLQLLALAISENSSLRVEVGLKIRKCNVCSSLKGWHDGKINGLGFGAIVNRSS